MKDDPDALREELARARTIARLARKYVMIREDPRATRARETDAYERLKEACDRIPA